ncbi:MAG TPA: glucosaminidase domain-containing protein, partial [Rhizobacter sp.]|nr:glucosaminidase domain-containing protein [Rhizobacter sp.]
KEIRHVDGSPSYNLFGIKAGADWKGAVAEVGTTEYVNGKAQRTTAKFRAYGSYAESFADYASTMKNSPRYAAVVASGADANGFAKGLQKAGYATDPAYAEKLTRMINTTLRLQRASA